MAMKYILASSSRGTVIQHIFKLCPEKIQSIMTDRDCGARQFAFSRDISHVEFSDWQNLDPEVPVILLGFKKILKPEFLKKRKVFNIHPSLLPRHSGWDENVHQSVLNSGDKISGVTLHEVTEIIDGGKILRQFPVPVVDRETVDTLKTKCQKVETFLCYEFINNKQTNIWWDVCVESLDSLVK